MKLNERKIKILEAIINDYILSAEPIGSRTIAQKYDWGLSAATIRNEMSDLEDMGFILQPHASAGRVPSDKGYRLYVDSLMRSREMTSQESDYLEEIVYNNINQIDYLMRETAKALAHLTNYTTVVSEPHVKRVAIKHVQLVPLDENSILLVLINDSKAVKNQVIRLGKAPKPETLNALSAVLNKHLQGVMSGMLNNELLEKLARDFGEYAGILKPVMEAVVNSLNSGEDIRLYTSGIKNILSFPEFSDINKARNFFQTLEEKEMLITLLGNNNDNGNDGIQIVIGTENDLIHMQNCSVIKANYRLGGQTFGNIGIIGPTRMDYTQVISVLNGIVYKINNIIKEFGDG